MRFVRNNPLSRTDPTGMFSLSCFNSCEKDIGVVIEKGNGGRPVKWICYLATFTCFLFPNPEVARVRRPRTVRGSKENVEKCV